MRLPDKYYDLILERDQLLEEEECILMHEPMNLENLYEVRLALAEIERELKLLEKERDFKYILVSEMIDLEYHECIFRTTKEFDNEEQARCVFNEEIESVKRTFEDTVELVEHEDIFHIANLIDEINIILYKECK